GTEPGQPSANKASKWEARNTFILRYKGEYHHWIGLRRDSKTQPWTWVNGTRFNN
ncbi:hypothetical protein NDU88_000675, partial [Pleurodeles waltl]